MASASIANLKTIDAYSRELKPLLPREVFRPARSRVLWLPAHGLVVALCMFAMASGRAHYALWPLLSLLIGCCFAGVTFVGHEALHGAVVHGRWAIRLVGWFGFLPFTTSPQLWMGWHNRIHHHHCNNPEFDTDTFPTLEEYQGDETARLICAISPGRGRWLGFIALAIGMTLQSYHMLLVARARNILSPRQHRVAILETLAGIAFWGVVAGILGATTFVFAYVLPLLVANAIVMAFILTNHCLSPQGEVNDPLHNSLSITLPSWLEWLTVGFGYHVEHHLFPSVSTRHAPRVRELLRARYSERYQSMPALDALTQIIQTARVYRDGVTLYDPRTRETWPTLSPRREVL